jgi:hypothetical protein
MPIVYVYRFVGTFQEKPQLDFPLPTPGARLDGLVLLRQEADERDDAGALAACLRFGFSDVEIQRAAAIQDGALQQPANAHMLPFVRHALAEGQSLVWYPADQGSPSQ